MDKRLIIAFMVTVFAVSGIVPVSAMMHDKGKGVAYHSKKDFDNKILKKAYFILMNSEKLELTDEQITKIKALKIEAKKELVRQKADIKLIEIDIKAIAHEESIDTEVMNKLIDAKYDLKKAKAKYIVAKYEELKNILTPKQKEELKGIRKQCMMMK